MAVVSLMVTKNGWPLWPLWPKKGRASYMKILGLRGRFRYPKRFACGVGANLLFEHVIFFKDVPRR